MKSNTDMPSAETFSVELDRLSEGVDRILKRWRGEDRPTKLTLLNDLAAAISPGANWGALKARQSERTRFPVDLNTSFIPRVDRNAIERPARLVEVKNTHYGITLAYLFKENRPLFGMRYAGDPIIGLELVVVVEGNGYSEASIYAKLIINRGGNISIVKANASDLEPVVAQLVYEAIQNLNSVELHPVMERNNCNALRIVLGPFNCVLSFPEIYEPAPYDGHAFKGLRVLLDEKVKPSVTDLDLALCLASAVAPLLGQRQFAEVDSVRFRLS